MTNNLYQFPKSTNIVISEGIDTMMPKATMTIIAMKLANGMYLKRCDDLDGRLEESIIEAFEGEKISKAKMLRITKKFCDLLLGE